MGNALYRAMKADPGGRPVCEDSARGLGVRVPRDIAAGEGGLVHPRTGGMSVTPNDPWLLPAHRRPRALKGTGQDPIFVLQEEALSRDLLYRPDPENPEQHGFVEPGASMRLDAYRGALVETAPRWRRVT